MGLRFESLLRPCVVLSSAERTNFLLEEKMATNKEIGEKYGIHPRDVEKIKFAFEVYDFKGDGKVDKFYIGDLIRACNLNPTNKTIVEIGGEKEKGKGILVMEDMYPLFKKAKDSKDPGGIHDFVEILKLFDKNEDKGLMKELCDPEDDEGFTPFMPFLERMCK